MAENEDNTNGTGDTKPVDNTTPPHVVDDTKKDIPPVNNDTPPVVTDTPPAPETESEFKTRSNAMILKHGNEQMNINHLPGHFARNVISKTPVEYNTRENLDKLQAEIKAILYTDIEVTDAHEGILKAMEDMPIGGYCY